MLRREQGIDDGASVVAFEPTVGGDGSAAGAVGAGVHHDHTVASAQQEFRLANNSNAIVGNAMKKENPVPVGIFRTNFPATEQRSIGCADVEVLARRTGDCE